MNRKCGDCGSYNQDTKNSAKQKSFQYRGDCHTANLVCDCERYDDPGGPLHHSLRNLDTDKQAHHHHFGKIVLFFITGLNKYFLCNKRENEISRKRTYSRQNQCAGEEEDNKFPRTLLCHWKSNEPCSDSFRPTGRLQAAPSRKEKMQRVETQLPRDH